MLPVGDEDGGQGAPADMLEAVGDVLGGGMFCVCGGGGVGVGGAFWVGLIASMLLLGENAQTGGVGEGVMRVR